MAGMFIGDYKSGNMLNGSAGWGDTAVIMPLTIYECYGDLQIIRNQYDCAKRWVDYMIGAAKQPAMNHEKVAKAAEYHTKSDGVCDAEYIWDTYFHWGEWLEPDVETDETTFQKAMINPDPEVSTVYLASSWRLLADMADLIGKKVDKHHM